MVEKKRKKKRVYQKRFRKAERKFIQVARVKLPKVWEQVARDFGISAGKRGRKPKKKRKKVKR